MFAVLVYGCWNNTGTVGAFAMFLKNCKFINLVNNNGQSFAYPLNAAGTTTDNTIGLEFIEITAPNASFDWTWATATHSSPITVDMWITKISTPAN